MIHKKGCTLGIVAMSLLLGGCASTNPPKPPQLDASVRIPLNQGLGANPSTSSRYTNMRLTISQVIEHYVPADIRVFTDESVSLATPIQYDNARPWTESLGASLAVSGIDMVVDLGKKTAVLNARPTTLQQVLDKHVPADYKVYLDEGVSKDTPIKFSTARPWIEELGKSLAVVKYDVIANLDKKIILVRPLVLTQPKTPAMATEQSAAQASRPANEESKTNQELK